MDLNEKIKNEIDSKSYESLLYGVRFAKIGDGWFQGGSGKYWLKRMGELRNQPGGQDIHVMASKSIGW